MFVFNFYNLMYRSEYQVPQMEYEINMIVTKRKNAHQKYSNIQAVEVTANLTSLWKYKN